MSTILVVEDSRCQRECISHQLRYSGWDVIEAGDGMEALDCIEALNPNLVLLDLVMPHMDGYGVCRMVKANPQTRVIPVVFLTGYLQKLDWRSGIKYAEACISKPWKPQELVNTIKRLIVAPQNSPASTCAEAWIEYGVVNIKMIELYECRADVWVKNGKQIIKLYNNALAAFDKALEIAPNHFLATKYQQTLHQKWVIWQEKLQHTKPCKVCKYYYGKDSINCAVHPFSRPEELCADWEP
ncbi:MAG: response regulator [Nostocaceae cyanobacterium]|nr:response regulator [Nostocaceae cyanobacterium]